MFYVDQPEVQVITYQYNVIANILNIFFYLPPVS